MAIVSFVAKSIWYIFYETTDSDTGQDTANIKNVGHRMHTQTHKCLTNKRTWHEVSELKEKNILLKHRKKVSGV